MIYMNGLVSLTGVRASPAVLSALLFTLMIAAFVGATVHATGSVERGVVARHLLPLSLTKVTEAVYVAVGDTNAPTYDNGGHNNNLSVILTSDGVVVVNGGDSYRLAARLHLAIKQLTPMSVVWVVNENGQGH
ncbi:MAG: hypothetical protein ACI9SB_001854, partial [Candidatus Azotimanducaceae bacterium]